MCTAAIPFPYVLSRTVQSHSYLIVLHVYSCHSILLCPVTHRTDTQLPYCITCVQLPFLYPMSCHAPYSRTVTLLYYMCTAAIPFSYVLSRTVQTHSYLIVLHVYSCHSFTLCLVTHRTDTQLPYCITCVQLPFHSPMYCHAPYSRTVTLLYYMCTAAIP